MNIRARLALTAAVTSALAVLLVAAALFFAIDGFLRASQADRLRAAASRVKIVLGWDRAAWEASWAIKDDPAFPRDLERRLVADGREVVRDEGFPAARPELPPGFYRVGSQFVLVSAVKAGNRVAYLGLSTGAGVVDEPRAAYLRALAVTLPPAMLLVALAGWFTAGRLLRPVRALERAAREIGEAGDLARPVPGAEGRDELGRLAATLQASFRRIGQTLEREAEFTRAAAHDLRAPLAAMRGRIQATLARPREAEDYRRELWEVGRDVDRLARLANHLLLLARDPGSLEFTTVSLASVAGAAVDRAREIAPDTFVDFVVEGPAEVRGDPVLLAQLADNLVGNALRHAPGAPVTVGVRRHGDHGDTVELRVADRGPGVAVPVLEKLGRPFYRPDAARAGEGSGLGLAIARRVAELHGGRLRLESRAGEGFAAVAELPAPAGESNAAGLVRQLT